MFLHSPVAQIAISVTVVTANIIILAKVHAVKKMHRIMKYLIVHLALADLLFGITYGSRAAVLVLEPGARTACVMLLAPAITFGGTSLTAMLAFYGYTVHCVVHFHLAAASSTSSGGGRHRSPSRRITLVALVCWIPWLVVGCVAFILLRSSSTTISPYSDSTRGVVFPFPAQPPSSVVIEPVVLEHHVATGYSLDSFVTTELPLLQQQPRAAQPSLCRITNKEHNQDFVLFVNVVFLAHVLLVLILQLVCIAALRRRLADARKMATAALALLHKKSTASVTVDATGTREIREVATAIDVFGMDEVSGVDGGNGVSRVESRVSLPAVRDSKASLSSAVFTTIVATAGAAGNARASVTSDGGQVTGRVRCDRKSEDSGMMKRRRVSTTPAVRYLRNSTAAFRIVVAVTVIFSMCWLPFIICLLLHVVCPPNTDSRCSRLTADVTFTFGALIVARGALNVFVYSVGCREFRMSCLSPANILRSFSARRLHNHQHQQQQHHQQQQLHHCQSSPRLHLSPRLTSTLRQCQSTPRLTGPSPTAALQSRFECDF